ncbi:DUF1028 domain-containing protein [Jatrophihabitans lederbergiae]|uniref:DUF1028 domain-containing protein n=1 Tax=Jatrophihabitans lederbergiae TaxID=3075547 RepID=A0ABU2JEH3_9ACTN|nr:DUF1028 domain-containing protein [Jatrophihabitans sp. DSM 44399]MDT0263332.1 DUF1028 domain-containing protein [Jatrophihabitans sp. DSM 44399]
MLKYNTFSITARCQRTGELGVAVSTKVPAVGMLCPFVQSKVGAVATQSWVNPYLGIWGLEYLASGHIAQETLEYLKTRDAGIEGRQLGIVDSAGGSAAFTGSECDTWNGDLTGPNYAIVGNMLVGSETLEAMKVDFEGDASRPLVERLLSALAAGQAAGGDKRGRQSAAVKVYSTEAYPALDLRVDEHSNPVAELQRVYEVARTDLVPLIEMLPTLNRPEGNFDSDRQRELGLLQDQAD